MTTERLTELISLAINAEPRHSERCFGVAVTCDLGGHMLIAAIKYVAEEYTDPEPDPRIQADRTEWGTEVIAVDVDRDEEWTIQRIRTSLDEIMRVPIIRNSITT